MKKGSSSNTIHIGDKHLVKGAKRKTLSDNKVTGFALRTTPNGSFSFYYQFLNKKTDKQVWIFIGKYPELSIERARNEARGWAKRHADGEDIARTARGLKARARDGSMTFRQLHDAYIADCQILVKRRWGMVPRLESWAAVRDALRRPLEHWGSQPISGITDDDVVALLKTWIDAGHAPMANRVRTLLHTMFQWAATTPRKWIAANPCAILPPKEEENPRERVLSADEIRTFWFGLDDPDCPCDRESKLALKLTLVTMLRSGEIVKIERDNVGPDTVTIPLKAVKNRRSKGSSDVTQPLNSLAKEVLAELFADPKKTGYGFPGSGKKLPHLRQQTLAHVLNRKSTDKAGKMGILEYLGMKPFTPHDLRRTAATILDQLGYDEATIGKVMSHKASGKDASPVTRLHYIVKTPIIARPVDVRVKALDDLDDALREILGLPRKGQKRLPAPQKLLTAA